MTIAAENSIPQSLSVASDRSVPSLDLSLLRRELETSSERSSITKKLVILAVSGVSFLAIGLTYSTLTQVLALFGVIAIHEGGHLLAMRLFGCRNLSVLFVPGLGAIATGETRSVPAAKQAVIYLAGPIPGIILGLALQWWLDNDFNAGMRTFVVFLFALNLFNLAPFAPLDGGRLLDRLFFSNMPKLRTSFYLASSAALVYFGFTLDLSSMLYLGGGMLGAAWLNWGFSSLSQRLLKDLYYAKSVCFSALSNEKLEEIISIVLRHKKWRKASPKEMAAILKQVEAQAVPVPKVWQSTGLFALYCGAVFLGLIGIGYLEKGPHPEELHRYKGKGFRLVDPEKMRFK